MQRAFHHRWRKVIPTFAGTPFESDGAPDLAHRRSASANPATVGAKRGRLCAGMWTHEYHKHGPHRHPRLPFRSPGAAGTARHRTVDASGGRRQTDLASKEVGRWRGTWAGA